MNIRFSRAAPADEQSLVILMREFYAIEHLAFDDISSPFALGQLLNDGSIGLAYLIHADAELVGYFVLTFGFSLEFHGRDALVDELYVRDEFRGKGLGRASLEFIETVCLQQDIKAVHLEVDRVNVRAQEVYRKAGYRDHDRYLLTKWLA
jgi:GNAT superfamily N-acetyltransferase